jgi:hypothetical protein
MMHHHTPHVPSATHARVSLAIHAVTYCIVNALLVVINLVSGGDYWFQWPLLGWGAGLGLHAWAVSRRFGLLGPGDADRRRHETNRDQPVESASGERPS